MQYLYLRFPRLSMLPFESDNFVLPSESRQEANVWGKMVKKDMVIG